MLAHFEHPADIAAAALQVIIASTQETLRALLVRLRRCVGQEAYAATMACAPWHGYFGGKTTNYYQFCTFLQMCHRDVVVDYQFIALPGHMVLQQCLC
jgi:hypothetical protein